ncbi:MAG: cupredoxin domain-containing protein [Acidobacteria bacterium]|nr:cupredoxin domain-containing protein [Acidobacteriota bacterium]
MRSTFAPTVAVERAGLRARPRLRVVALLGLATLAGGVLSPPITARQKSEPREIAVTAKRYTFEPSLIEVEQGEPVRLVVTAIDGVHGFAIKKVKVDKELMPNKAMAIDFVAKDAGEFPIMCTVICGEGHAQMTGTLRVVAKAAP